MADSTGTNGRERGREGEEEKSESLVCTELISREATGRGEIKKILPQFQGDFMR